MKRRLKRIAVSLMAAGFFLSAASVGAKAYAAGTDSGTASAVTDTDYTLEEMLTSALEEEYLAQAEYAAVMDSFGATRPFSNFSKAEANHISLLTPLLSEYKVALPDKDWASLVTVPATLDEVYSAGITAEKNNITMYESYLKQNLPEDVKEVFTLLLKASERHLAAFERQADGTCDGNGNGYGRNGNGAGRHMGGRNGANGGCGQSGNGNFQGSCIYN